MSPPESAAPPLFPGAEAVVTEFGSESGGGVAAPSASHVTADVLLAALEGMQEAVLVFGADGRVIVRNRAAQELFAVRAAREPSNDGQPSDDQANRLRSAVQELVQRVLQGQQVDDVEVLLPQSSGHQNALLRIAGRPLAFGAGVAGAVVVCRDVTVERRAAEEGIALVENAPDTILTVDSAGKILRANRQAEVAFGYRREEMIGAPVEILIPHRYRESHAGHRAQYAADPRTRPMGSTQDLFGLRRDGSEFPVEIALSPLKTIDATLFTAVIRDVTDRKRAEIALRRAKDELEQRVLDRTTTLQNVNHELSHRNEENEAFVYSISHDLRSPLVNLLGFSKELGNVCQELREIVSTCTVPPRASRRLAVLLDDDAPQALHFIQNSVSRLNRIVDALLRLSRAGRVNYRWADVDLNAIATRVVDDLSSNIRERGATVTIGKLPVVKGDASAIELIFANLIGNSLKYAHPDRPCVIEVGCSGIRQDGEQPSSEQICTLFVKDNGLGIPKTGHDKVFRVFQRLHPKVCEGEGVGLAMLERIVTRHRGRAWFESEEGVGTTFFVDLHAADAIKAT